MDPLVRLGRAVAAGIIRALARSPRPPTRSFMLAAPRRPVFGRLLPLLLLIPLLDLALLVWIGGRVGAGPVLALVVLTAFTGVALARRAGLQILRRFQARLASGQMPGPELTDGLIILVSAALLVAPGVLTDVAGLLGLFPPTRAGIRRLLGRRLQRDFLGGSIRVATWPPPPAAPQQDDVIDVEFEEVTREARLPEHHDAPGGAGVSRP